MPELADDLEGVLARLSDQQRRFADGICVGLNGVAVITNRWLGP